jgi:hypothetical protein
MAGATLVVSFGFASNSQGFTFTGANGNFSGTYESSGGNPGGCLQSTVASGGHSNYAYWKLTTTWGALGIPSGGLVNSVGSLTCDVNVAVTGSGNSVAFGAGSSNPVTAGNFQGIIVEDVTSGTYEWLQNFDDPYNGALAWTTVNAAGSGGGAPEPASGGITNISVASTGSVNIWLGAQLSSGTSGTATLLVDNAGFTITYTPLYFPARRIIRPHRAPLWTPTRRPRGGRPDSGTPPIPTKPSTGEDIRRKHPWTRRG